MANPDVRVRLSAEGVSEVVAALKKVGDEAGKASGKAKASADRFGASLGGLKNTLAALGATVSVGAFVNFVKSASQATEAVGKMAQTVGTSVSNMSALNFAAVQANMSTDDLGTALARFAKSSTEAAAGVPTMVKAMDAIRLPREELAKFNQMDTAERLEAVARAFGKLQDGPAKSAAAIALFGRAGARLLPLLNDIAAKGLGGLRDAADDLGVLMNDDLVIAVESVNDAMDRLALASQVAGAKFVEAGSGPMTRAINVLNLAVKQATPGFTSFGQIVQTFIAAAIVGMIDVADTTLTSFKIMGDAIGGVVKIVKAFVTEGPKGAAREVQQMAVLIDKDMAQMDDRRFKRRVKLAEDTKQVAKSAGEQELVDLRALYSETAALERAKLDAAQKARQAAMKLAEQSNTAAYERGLKSVADYYDKRIDIVNRGVRAELDSIQKRIDLEANNPDANEAAKNIATLQASIQKVRDEGQAQVVSLNADRVKEEQRLTDASLRMQDDIMRAKGLNHQVAMAQMEDELETNDKLLRQQGVPPAERATIKADARAAYSQVLKFEEATRRAALAFARFDTDVAAINQRVAAGLQSQVSAEKELLDLEAALVPAMRKRADALVAAAKTPEQRQAAAGFNQQVKQMELALQAANDFGALFKATLQDATRDTLADFFGSGINQATSFADAMRTMALSVINSLQRMAAQFLATKLVMALLSSGSQESAPIGPIMLPGIPTTPVTRAGGGIIRGRPGIDTNLAWLTDQEFVVRAGVVKRPGMLPLLERLNAGLLSPSALSGARGYSIGGLVGGGRPGSSTWRGSMTVGLSDGLVLRELSTPAGRDAVLRIVSRNPRSMRGAMGV